jgi:hypothetical protein
MSNSKENLLQFYIKEVDQLANKLGWFVDHLGLRTEIKVETSNMEMEQETLGNDIWLHVPWISIDDLIIIPNLRKVPAKDVRVLTRKEFLNILFWEIQLIVHDPGVRYHSDGTGTPPSDDYKDIMQDIRQGDILQVTICELVKLMVNGLAEDYDYERLERMEQELQSDDGCACIEAGHEHPDENAQYRGSGIWNCGKIDQQ